MKSEIKVSVIVPVYNGEKYLCECLESIINQSYSNIEIILIDDASKDKSLDICQKYAQQDERIIIVSKLKNQGLSSSRETGFRHASGDWVCFCDDDDCIWKYAIEYMVDEIDEETDIIAGKYKNVLSKYFRDYDWENNIESKNVIELEHKEALNMIGAYKKYEMPECLWGKIYRKSIFDIECITKYKDEFSLIYFEDVLLTSLLIKASNRVKIIDKYIYIHRLDQKSVSRSPYELEFNLQTARSVEYVLERIDSPDTPEAYETVLRNYLLVFSKNWYLVWKYHHKNQDILREMEQLFDHYYEKYCKQKKCNHYIIDSCLAVFNCNKLLFCVTICPLWFQGIAKLKWDR